MGKFIGCLFKDCFIVKDDIIVNMVDWNDINMFFDLEVFDCLYDKIIVYFAGCEIFVCDVFVCVDERYCMGVCVVNEYFWSNMFVYNMFFCFIIEEL